MTPAQTAAPSEAIRRLDKLARTLDSRFTIPGTTIRVGVDAIIGLVPVVGDALGAILSLWIVLSGIRMGATSRTVVKMLLNVGLELLIGLVPIVGDVFDVMWQANHRNVELLRAELAPQPPDIAAERHSSSARHTRLLALLALVILLGLAISSVGYG